MKCPIKPDSDSSAIIKEHGLVYIGRGNKSAPLFKDKRIFSLCTDDKGKGDNELLINSGFGPTCHYFVTRADAAKHFPHALPKPRKVARYFTHSRGFHAGEAYFLFDGKPFFVWKSGRKEPAPTYTLAEAEGWVKGEIWKEITKAEALKLLDPKPVAPPAPKVPEPEVRKPMVGEVWKVSGFICLAAQIHRGIGEFIEVGGNRVDDKEHPLEGYKFPVIPNATFLADSLSAYYKSIYALAPDPRIDAIKKILA